MGDERTGIFAAMDMMQREYEDRIRALEARNAELASLVKVGPGLEGQTPMDMARIVTQTAFESLFPQWVRTMANALRDTIGLRARAESAEARESSYLATIGEATKRAKGLEAQVARLTTLVADRLEAAERVCEALHKYGEAVGYDIGAVNFKSLIDAWKSASAGAMEREGEG